MSRYVIEALDKDRYTVVVGWDNPLVTWFAQVKDNNIKDKGNNIVLWLGADKERIPGTDVLKLLLEQYAVIPRYIEEKLMLDAYYKR